MKPLSSDAQTVPFILPVQTLVVSAAHLTVYQREHADEAPFSKADPREYGIEARVDRYFLLDGERFETLLGELRGEFPEWVSFVELLQELALQLPNIAMVRFDVEADRLAGLPVFEDEAR